MVLLVHLEKTTSISGILDIYDSFPKILLFLMVYGCIMSDDLRFKRFKQKKKLMFLIEKQVLST